MAPIANGEEGWEWAEEREGKEMGGVVVAVASRWRQSLWQLRTDSDGFSSLLFRICYVLISNFINEAK